MSRTVYRLVVGGALLLVLVGVNFTVWQRENLLKDGTPVLLELAPVDPRSLMQGDYMALRFALSQKLQPIGETSSAVTDGYVVVKRDGRNVASFARVYRDGETLAADESRIRYRLRNRDVRIVTNAWFFKEGSGDVFAAARYGELRVGADGEALLMGMRDKDLKLLVTRDEKTKL
jgi:uncharacterized membrane-anchored protein